MFMCKSCKITDSLTLKVRAKNSGEKCLTNEKKYDFGFIKIPNKVGKIEISG